MTLALQAIAAHSNNGLVIVQVERIVERGSLHPRLVHLPAALVHKVCQQKLLQPTPKISTTLVYHLSYRVHSLKFCAYDVPQTFALTLEDDPARFLLAVPGRASPSRVPQSEFVLAPL